MDECARSLNVLLTVSEGTREEGREDETTILVNWLYRADVTMRMLDESRLEHVVLELIAAWQDQPGRSVQWLSQSLRRTVGAESGTEEDRSNEQDDESSYWEVGEATLARYEQWLAEQHSKFLDPDVKRRVELLALLLQAVMAKESAEARVVDHLAYRSRSQTLRATFDQVVMAGTSPVPARAEQVIMWLAGAADQLLQEEGANLLPEQQAILQRWMQFASQAPKAGHSEDFLNEILDQMGESIGLGAWVLTRSFLSLSGEHSLAEDFRKEFDSLATQLRLGENQQEAREAAKRMYRLLKRLRHGQTNETVLEQGAGALLMFTSLLWPGGRKTALSILGTDASWTAAFRAVSEFVDPSQPNLMYGFQMEDNNRRISWIALLDSVISGLSDVDQIDQPELTADPITQAPSQAKFHAEGQYYQTLLAVPPGEALGL